MPTVVIVGAGFSGCAAALAAARAGCEAILVEKTDMVAGLAVLTGVLDTNGGLTAHLEAKALGGGDIFAAAEEVTLHQVERIAALGLEHVRFFNVLAIEGVVRRKLEEAGVKVHLMARAKGVKMKDSALSAIVLSDGAKVEGATFVDATGGSGTVAECTRYGLGCVMCIMRCPTFGGRVSISARAGVTDLVGMRADGKIGALSSAFNLVKDSVAPWVREELNRKGYAILPMPKELIRLEKLGEITASDNARREFIENFRVIDNGYAKVSVHSYMPLNELHAIPGFENARMADPYSGGIGNAVRGLAMAPRDNSLKVQGLDNLYCAGEKSGPQNGLAPAIVSGLLAGHNAARKALGKEPLLLPRSLAIGDFTAFVGEQMATQEGLRSRSGFGGGAYFRRMKEKDLYCCDEKEVRERVEKAGLAGIFASRVR